MSIKSRVIYLDSNATTPVMPLALDAARTVMEDDYGNPSSVHSSGLQAKAVMENARKKASDLLGCENGRLLFVSGATEGIQTAVFSALIALRDRIAAGEKIGTDLLYGATEHKAVPESLHHWNNVLGLKFKIIAIPVDEIGRHDLNFLKSHIAGAGLVCTMAANNETGIITDLQAIEAILKTSTAYWLVDGVQALGKLPLKLHDLRIDYSPFSGHKLYAPKGIGLLYVHKDAPFTPLLAGGGQESSLRSGTENVSGIAALGAVLNALDDGVSFRDHASLVKMRLQLLHAMREAFPGLVLNAPLENSLPTTLNFSVPGLTSKELLDLFDAADVRVSAGSACSAAKAQPSFVLQAMALPEWQAASAVRVSFGPATTQETIDEACLRIRTCGEAIRRTCLVTGDIEPLPAEGVIQLTFGAACTWIVADSASKQCVVIDPLPELIERIAKYVRCQNYQVLAIGNTNSHNEQHKHNLNLMKQLAESFVGNMRDAGFAPNAMISVTLKDGRTAPAILCGNKLIAQVSLNTGTKTGAVYLLDNAKEHPEHQHLQATFAFTGDIETNEQNTDAQSAVLLAEIGEQTLLCAAHDFEKLLVTTVHMHELVSAENMTVDSNNLNAFMQAHPGAILVDVREPYEQALSNFTVPDGIEVIHMPITRLANGVERWLKQSAQNCVPLVFFCRSGGRSVQAVQCLRRLGYQQAWHVAGGLALWQH